MYMDQLSQPEPFIKVDIEKDIVGARTLLGLGRADESRDILLAYRDQKMAPHYRVRILQTLGEAHLALEDAGAARGFFLHALLATADFDEGYGGNSMKHLYRAGVFCSLATAASRMGNEADTQTYLTTAMQQLRLADFDSDLEDYVAALAEWITPRQRMDDFALHSENITSQLITPRIAMPSPDADEEHILRELFEPELDR
jgi:hypothetical protein